MEGCIDTKTTLPWSYCIAKALLNGIAILICFEFDGTWYQFAADGLIAVVLNAITQCPLLTIPDKFTIWICCLIVCGLETIILIAIYFAEATAFYYLEVFSIIEC